MADENVRIDPWSSTQSTDYARIRDQFGLSELPLHRIPEPSMLHRRGIIFAHREFDTILNAIARGEPFGVLTGLMPSGKMHLGHTLVIEQIRWLQSMGADVTIAVADLESLATRGTSLDEGRRVALDEYVANYPALGLDPDRTSVYFQSRRPIVQRLGFVLGEKTNRSTMESIYGFDGSTNLAHVQAPLVQAGDILHPQLEEHGGLRPIVVPVGIDQDPHIRFTRDLAASSNWFNINRRKKGGLTIALSIQHGNHTCFGVEANGRVNMQVRRQFFDRLVERLNHDGWSDMIPNPKHGTVEIPAATEQTGQHLRHSLLKFERELGGLGLLPPASTYHRFAVGLTGDKMSSSNPETTIFLDDEDKAVIKKIRAAFSGGRETVEEHRRYGGDTDKDIAFQYLATFFEPDDKILADIGKSYREGTMLSGELKQHCIDSALEWLRDFRERRDSTEGVAQMMLADDAQ